MKIVALGTIAIVLITLLSLYETPFLLTHRPIVGIVAGPSDFPSKYPYEEYSYIKVTYTRYITESGGEPLFIPYDLEDKELYSLLDGVNAILIPGGGARYWEEDEKTGQRRLSDYVLKSKRIVDYAQQKNREGIYLPLIGICQGMEVILMALTEDPYLLDTYVDANTHDQVYITEEGTKSKMFGTVPEDDRIYIKDHGTLAFNHMFGYNLTSLDGYPELKQSLVLTATAQDKNNKTFMAFMEAKDWPLYITMSHNELILWEKELGHKNHTGRVLDFVMRMGRFYVAEAKKDTRKFDPNFDWRRWDLKEFKPVFVEDGQPDIYVAKGHEVLYKRETTKEFFEVTSDLTRLLQI